MFYNTACSDCINHYSDAMQTLLASISPYCTQKQLMKFHLKVRDESMAKVRRIFFFAFQPNRSNFVEFKKLNYLDPKKHSSWSNRSWEARKLHPKTSKSLKNAWKRSFF